MIDLSFSELLIVAVVAILVIGPKDLPSALVTVGKWVGKARGMARQFRMGMDDMVRDAELKEMERNWAEQNARIMAQHPSESLNTTDDPLLISAPLHVPDDPPPPVLQEQAEIAAARAAAHVEDVPLADLPEPDIGNDIGLIAKPDLKEGAA